MITSNTHFSVEERKSNGYIGYGGPAGRTDAGTHPEATVQRVQGVALGCITGSQGTSAQEPAPERVNEFESEEGELVGLVHKDFDPNTLIRGLLIRGSLIRGSIDLRRSPFKDDRKSDTPGTPNKKGRWPVQLHPSLCGYVKKTLETNILKRIIDSGPLSLEEWQEMQGGVLAKLNDEVDKGIANSLLDAVEEGAEEDAVYGWKIEILNALIKKTFKTNEELEKELSVIQTNTSRNLSYLFSSLREMISVSVDRGFDYEFAVRGSAFFFRDSFCNYGGCIVESAERLLASIQSPPLFPPLLGQDGMSRAPWANLELFGINAKKYKGTFRRWIDSEAAKEFGDDRCWNSELEEYMRCCEDEIELWVVNEIVQDACKVAIDGIIKTIEKKLQ